MSIGDNLYEQKWQKFLKRVWLFRFIPFVDFVLAAGSLAIGDIKEDSDFDVIVGCRQGRIFTARFSCWFVFSLFGWYAKHPNKTKDKFCFNHFVTPASYRLSPPYNEYWKKLYQSLVPVYGVDLEIQSFFDANSDWAGPVRNRARAQARSEGPFGRAVSNGMGWLLSGKFGNVPEAILKKIQIRKIEKSPKITKTYNPRIIYNDNELEFHPNTKRIEELLKK